MPSHLNWTLPPIMLTLNISVPLEICIIAHPATLIFLSSVPERRGVNQKGVNKTYFHEVKVNVYGCEVWSLTAREERKLRVFENMVLRINLDLGGMR